MLARLLLCGVALVLPFGGAAWGDDVQLWPVVNVNHSFTERWGGHLMARVRIDDDISEVKDVLVRPFVTWRAHDTVTLDLGYDYLHSFQLRTENRAWQAVEHRFDWRDFSVKNRLRVGERFIEGIDGVVVRLRYRLRGKYQIDGSRWYAALSNESFWNVNDRGEGPVQGFAQNRLRAALGVRTLRRLRIEAGYEWQHVERRGQSSANRHVIVLEFSVNTWDLPTYDWSPR